MQPTYKDRERVRAIGWKRSSDTLPDDARDAAPYVNRDGTVGHPRYDFCLPTHHADHNLLPEVRELAIELFAELGIPWHNGTPVGLPSNHLLSSQVQCVNALGAMVLDPDRLVRAFGETLGTEAVEQIEPGRYLTFEYIGPTDFFGESPDAPRTRGAHCTSVDAAFLHRTRDGLRELMLVEWKYTEEYPPRKPDPRRDDTRWNRYGDALTDPASPVRSDVLDFVDLCQEPIYQLVRQQLLAHELEKARGFDVDRVRVAHISPPANLAYRNSLTPAHREVGGDVSQVWTALLRHPDRFVSIDSAVFLDPAVTSQEYVRRYGAEVVWDDGRFEG